MSKSLSVHSATSPSLLMYISVPTSMEDHLLFAGTVPGSYTIPYIYIHLHNNITNGIIFK